MPREKRHIRTKEEHCKLVFQNRTLAADPKVTRCTCSNTLCDWHGKFMECAALHRYHNKHVPFCLQPIITGKLATLAGTVEMVTTKKVGMPLEYRHYVHKRDQEAK